MTFTVRGVGSQALVEDLGRPGLAAMGVGPSGAFDRRALRQGNSLLDNDPVCAGIEVLAGGLSLFAGDDHLVVLSGAPAAATIDAESVTHGRVLSIHRGQVLTLGALAIGLRTYVTVAGGFDADRVLGSASTDILSGLGPLPLAIGDRLRVGPRSGSPGDFDVPALIGTGDIVIRVRLGPRNDWFTDDAVRTLFDAVWTVSQDSNRVGLRLSGPPIERARPDELPSEPCVRGSIQIAADGVPIVLGPDHPVTGGYPVIAVVLDADTDALAQARPGQALRFQRR